MTVSLRLRMILTYSLLVCLFIFLMGLVVNRFALSLFHGFVREGALETGRQAAALVAEQYSPETESFDLAALRIIATDHARRGYFLTVENSAGFAIWTEEDPRAFGMMHGMMHEMPETRRGMMRGSARWRNWGTPGGNGGRGRMPFADSHEPDERNPGGLVFPITDGGRNVGRVTVETRAHYAFDENQLAFVSSLNRFLLLAGIAFAVLSVAVTALLANALSMPILTAARAAARMAGGDRSARVPERHRTRELGELSSSLNRLAVALEEGDARQRRLTADVAHELRTPLAALQGNVEAMIDGVWDPTRERLESCREEIVRLSALVGDLGKLSLLERGDPGLSVSRFDLDALLSSAVAQFAPASMEKGISLLFSPGSRTVLADRDRLKQVFVNLLSNAVKYTDEGRIEVSVSESGDRYEISVADTGIGIPGDELPRVFDRLFRSDESRSRATGGAGIGLAIASAIVSAHGGRIEAKSEVGVGSVFSVFLAKDPQSS